MVKSGLDLFLNKVPLALKGLRIGILCHAPSIAADFKHITDHLYKSKDLKLCAIFGPQHGLSGQTQDNMIEWEGEIHPVYNVPVFSLYGETRKPTSGMLEKIDALIIDLQDIGARPYTYIWTMKLCMEACNERGLPVWILDRPNPVAALSYDGPVLKKDFFTFVGGANLPLCHRMTIGEIAIWLKTRYYPGCMLEIVRMENWNRNLMYSQTGLQWILPSPNMPTLQTATVYPGMVLFEALNISEGRGSTVPFELFGAPFLNPYKTLDNLEKRNIPGCRFRLHNFIPTFNKYMGELCQGLQIHITDMKKFMPVSTAAEIIEAIIQTSYPGALIFNDPPYEYEEALTPFDILSGDDQLRKALMSGASLKHERERWRSEIEEFRKEFAEISIYGDC